MRPFFLVALAVSTADPPATPAATVPVAVVVPACQLTPPRAPEPPAWLLLAGAVAALGAGRLAAR